MLGELDKRLIFKFLERNYPVSRIKHDMRFKRGIVLDDGVYLLGNVSDVKRLYFKLSQIIEIVFYCDEITSKLIVSTYLKIK